MKSLFILAIAAISIHAHAGAISVECLAGDLDQINKFSATGAVEVSSKGEAKGTFAIATKEAGVKKDFVNLGADQVSGTATVLAAGQFGVTEVTSLALVSSDSKAHLVLNLGLKGAASSTLLINGVSYKSECSVAK